MKSPEDVDRTSPNEPQQESTQTVEEDASNLPIVLPILQQ
jgi:hypothetical protein